uniref:Uncharacterized protein n=1 Tax=Globodera rostochiensis TaxID=31243 RepID=A0A914H9S6_GLORO
MLAVGRPLHGLSLLYPALPFIVVPTIIAIMAFPRNNNRFFGPPLQRCAKKKPTKKQETIDNRKNEKMPNSK